MLFYWESELPGSGLRCLAASSRSTKLYAMIAGWCLLTACSSAEQDAIMAPPPSATDGSDTATFPPHTSDANMDTLDKHDSVILGSDGQVVEDSALAVRLNAIQMRLSVLGSEVFDFWKTKGPDRKYGGFYGRLDREGNPGPPTDKGVIQQARHLWAVSTWAGLKNQRTETKPMADSLYQFLTLRFRDQDGEFFLKVNDAGDRVIDRSKWMYAQGFAIYGLVEYARVFNVPEAGQIALQCFRSLDKRTHDSRYGGYAAPQDPPWLPSGATKDTNTIIHLLEPFTTLYHLSSDALVRERLQELVGIFTDKIVQPQGYAHTEFASDWQPIGSPRVSYGHDLETAWLLLEAARAVGRDGDSKVLNAIKAIGTHASQRGFDPQKGGYFEGGVPQGAANALEKVWWVQAESLLGLWRLYQLTGETVHIDRLESTLTWIENYQRDKQYGEWYWGILPDGSPGSHGNDKGGEWKASYHNLRALLFGESWIGKQN